MILEKRKYSFLFLVFVFFSCNKPAIEGGIKNKFFDFKGFFTQQTDSLTKLNYRLNKTINWEEKVESLELDSVNWKKELQLFLDFNPNSSTVVDLYQCDTLESPTGEVEITLTATDKKALCRLARVNLNKHRKVELIEMMMEKKDALSRMNYTLGYQPMKGYVIQCETFGVGGKSFKMDILGQFQNLSIGY